MIQPGLLKELERKGFELEYPDTLSIEGKIIALIKEDDTRLLLAIPLLMMEKFDYSQIINKLGSEKLENSFKKLICISSSILKDEGIGTQHLTKIIRDEGLTLMNSDITGQEMEYYHEALIESLSRQKSDQIQELEKNIKLRSRLNLNQALHEIFSPGKIRILEKIFAHEKLTNTELKYYYRGIKPLINSISNENLHNYLRIIGSIKKLT